MTMAFLEPTDIDSVEKNHDYDYDFECKICHSLHLSDINQSIRSGITGHVVFIGALRCSKNKVLYHMQVENANLIKSNLRI